MPAWVLLILLNGAWVMPETGEFGHPYLVGEACLLHMVKYDKSYQPKCVNTKTGMEMKLP